MTYLVAAGTALQAMGAIQGGKAARAQAEAEASALRDQVGIEQINIDLERARLLREKRREAGNIVATFSASGIEIGDTDPNSAPMLALTESAFEFSNAINVAEYNAKVRQRDLMFRADLRKFAGKQAERAGYTSALSSIVTGGLRMAGAGAGGTVATSGSAAP